MTLQRAIGDSHGGCTSCILQSVPVTSVVFPSTESKLCFCSFIEGLFAKNVSVIAWCATYSIHSVKLACSSTTNQEAILHSLFLSLFQGGNFTLRPGGQNQVINKDVEKLEHLVCDLWQVQLALKVPLFFLLMMIRWWWLRYMLSMMLTMIKMMIHVFNCEPFSRFPMLLCMSPSLLQSIYLAVAVDPFTSTYLSRCLFRNSEHKDVMMCMFVCWEYCCWFRFRASYFFAVLARLLTSGINQCQLVHEFVCIICPLVTWHLTSP